ncbi:MAG: glycoside hydrolase family 43 protein [Akkermansiaceae bacterium]|nr:glycoside hydrolase family 43 protein [Verrucomicrobiales bacterium]
MIFHGGFYYYCESRNKRQIFLRRSRTIADIGSDPGVCVWTAPTRGGNCDNLWAPELHLIDGCWYIYYAADDGKNENHRMWVIRAEGSSPLGKYECGGQLETGGWAIDGTILTLEDNRRYFVWSGWPGQKDGLQNIYIAPMKDPMTISGPRVLIAAPTQKWERVGLPICEGPQVLRRNGDIFIVYSASASWTPDYCLGLLHNNTGDVLNPAKWIKHGPVFQKTDQVWGVGHCSFVKSMCQSEDWIVYHAKSSPEHGWEDRDVHAKQFAWSSDGFPDFGEPLPRRAPLTPPGRTRSVPLAA